MDKQGKVNYDSFRVSVRKLRLQEIAENIRDGYYTAGQARSSTGFSTSSIEKAIKQLNKNG